MNWTPVRELDFANYSMNGRVGIHVSRISRALTVIIFGCSQSIRSINLVVTLTRMTNERVMSSSSSSSDSGADSIPSNIAPRVNKQIAYVSRKPRSKQWTVTSDRNSAVQTIKTGRSPVLKWNGNCWDGSWNCQEVQLADAFWQSVPQPDCT